MPWSDYPPKGVIFRERVINSGVDSASIIVTNDVANTVQEAKAIGQLASELGLQSIILATSSNHIDRVLSLFEKEVGELFPYPVDFFPSGHEWTIFKMTPTASAFNQTSDAIRELLGRLYYRWLL